jgi:uncharacterized protein YdaL
MAREDRPRVERIRGRSRKAAGAGAPVFCALFASAAFARGASAPPRTLRVCVYYDVGRTSSDKTGELHAIMLENLLGHFREAAASLSPAADYEKGGLARCDRAAYIGSDFDAPLGRAFLADVGAYAKPFLWINYGIQKLQASMGSAAFSARAGFAFVGMRGFDPRRDGGGIPAFYRAFAYKGELFEKTAYVRSADGAVIAAPEIAIVRVASATVLSAAIHSGTGESTPYITEQNGFFYIADDPFVYAAEGDRYLIAADLLFDFLKLPPRSARRYALVRLEDIHPEYDLKLLYAAVDLLKERKVPFAISLIPKYVPAGAPESAGVELGRRPEFVKALRYAVEGGGVILLHGYTHNVSGLADCPPLPSGADVEFWDRCRQSPLPYDSAEFARGRIAKARSLLAGVGLAPAGWVTPHYMASRADFVAFGSAFDRTVQRVRYATGGIGAAESPEFVSQFFPYTIFKDHYGQFVWPENLGYVPMPGAEAGGQEPEEIVRNARRSRVVRDAWASFFWHPQLMSVPGEKERFADMIDGIRAAGYEFVSLDELRARGE